MTVNLWRIALLAASGPVLISIILFFFNLSIGTMLGVIFGITGIWVSSLGVLVSMYHSSYLSSMTELGVKIGDAFDSHDTLELKAAIAACYDYIVDGAKFHNGAQQLAGVSGLLYIIAVMNLYSNSLLAQVRNSICDTDNTEKQI